METIGAVRVSRMITFASVLSLSSLYICWQSTDKQNPTILETTLEYPYTIIFRGGMMYSLFIFFLQLLFVSWWIASSPSAKLTRLIWITGMLGLAAYGLFVCCIDRARINYPLARQATNLANLFTSFTMWLIMFNLRRIRNKQFQFVKKLSWKLKKIVCLVHLVGFSAGLLMYLGQLDIWYKPSIEYTIVISNTLFFFSFALDFKKFKMDIDSPVRENIRENPPNNNPQLRSPYSVQASSGNYDINDQFPQPYQESDLKLQL